MNFVRETLRSLRSEYIYYSIGFRNELVFEWTKICCSDTIYAKSFHIRRR